MDARSSKAGASALGHERSLRRSAEVLYLKVSHRSIVPSLRVSINGVDVEYRDWSTYLQEMERMFVRSKPAFGQT